MTKKQIIRKIAENYSMGYVYPETLKNIIAPAKLLRQAYEEFDPEVHCNFFNNES